MNHKRLHLPIELITDSHSQEQKANQWLEQVFATVQAICFRLGAGLLNLLR